MPSMENLVPFTVRNFNVTTDLAPLVQLRNAIAGEQTNPITVDQQRVELNEPNQTPEKDRWVAQENGKFGSLVGQSFGYHTVPERYLAWVEVHPEWRHQGVGRTLLVRVMERAQAVGATHILIYAKDNDKAAQAFLESNGFWAKSDGWFMRAPDNLPLMTPQWPTGYSVRSFAEVQDLAILWQVCYGSYGDLWGHGENSQINRAKPPETTIIQWLDGWEPKGENIMLLFAPNNEVAGICRGFTSNGTADQAAIGQVDGPGIVARYRHLGLQKPLALTMMHWLRARGQTAFELHAFGDSPATINLYHAIGFTLDLHLIAYHLDLQ